MRRSVVAATVTILTLHAAPVVAHGTFVDARPLPGVTVGGTVDEVAFLFPEAIVPEGAVIVVTGPEGIVVPASGSIERLADTVVRIPIEVLSRPGEYGVDYSIPAADGFAFDGSFTFFFDPAADALEPLPYARGGRAGLLAVVAVSILVVATGVIGWRRRRPSGDVH
jgi:methionine-rich copper-binding protein CopC